MVSKHGQDLGIVHLRKITVVLADGHEVLRSQQAHGVVGQGLHLAQGPGALSGVAARPQRSPIDWLKALTSGLVR